IPSRGITGLVGALAGVAIIVFALTRKRAPRVVRWAMMAAGVFAFVALPNVMPVVGNVGVGFFPEDDRAEFTIALETPPGSNLDYTRLKAEELARLAKSHKEVLYTYTTLGGGLS